MADHAVLMGAKEMEDFRRKIETAEAQGDFLSLILPLTETEQDVLYILIKENKSMPLKSIRNAIIEELAFKNAEKILSTIPTKITNAKENQKFSSLPAFLAKMVDQPGFKNAVKASAESYQLVFSFDDNLAVKNDFTPSTYTEKIKIWEKALRDISESVPSLSIVDYAVKALTAIQPPFIEKRPVLSKKVTMLFYVSPMIYELWMKWLVKFKDKKLDYSTRDYLGLRWLMISRELANQHRNKSEGAKD